MKEPTGSTDQNGYFTELKTAIESYLTNAWNLLRIEVAEKSAKIGNLVFIAIMAACFVIYILFSLSMMLGYVFVKLTDSTIAGFGILTGLYFLILVIIWFGRHFWVKKIAGLGIKAFFSKNDSDEKHN